MLALQILGVPTCMLEDNLSAEEQFHLWLRVVVPESETVARDIPNRLT